MPPSHPGQLSLLPPVGREMSTSQSAVIFCCWAVKAGMAHSNIIVDKHVNGKFLPNTHTLIQYPVWSLVSTCHERFRDEFLIKSAIQIYRYVTFLLRATRTDRPNRYIKYDGRLKTLNNSQSCYCEASAGVALPERETAAMLINNQLVIPSSLIGYYW